MKVFVAGYKGAGLGGGLIKWFTFGGYSHVSLVFEIDNPEGNTPRMLEIDALQGKGVSSRYDGAIKSKRDLFLVPCDLDVANDIYLTARHLCGCKYDWAGIWGFLHRKKRENPKKWFCSELVAHCLKENGIELLRLPPWKQSPVMVCASTVLEKVN